MCWYSLCKLPYYLLSSLLVHFLNILLGFGLLVTIGDILIGLIQFEPFYRQIKKHRTFLMCCFSYKEGTSPLQLQ